MSRTGWKARERECAAIVNGRRYPANQGGRVGVESDAHVCQVKERKVLSLAQLEALAVEMECLGMQKSPPKSGVVMVKRSAGRGVPTPFLVVMTASTFRELTPGEPIGGDGESVVDRTSG